MWCWIVQSYVPSSTVWITQCHVQERLEKINERTVVRLRRWYWLAIFRGGDWKSASMQCHISCARVYTLLPILGQLPAIIRSGTGKGLSLWRRESHGWIAGLEAKFLCAIAWSFNMPSRSCTNKWHIERHYWASIFNIGNVAGLSNDHVTRARKNMGEGTRLLLFPTLYSVYLDCVGSDKRSIWPSLEDWNHTWAHTRYLLSCRMKSFGWLVVVYVYPTNICGSLLSGFQAFLDRWNMTWMIARRWRAQVI